MSTPGINPDVIPWEYGLPLGIILTVVALVQNRIANRQKNNVNR